MHGRYVTAIRQPPVIKGGIRMYGQKRNGDPEEIRITVYKNDVREESKLLKLFGK